MREHLHTFCRYNGIPMERFDKRVLELRALGLSFRDIAVVVSFYEGWHGVSAWQVRHRLEVHGALPSQQRERVMA